MRVMNLANKMGAKLLAKTVVALSDGALLNFCYRIDGVASFETEYRRASWFEWQGVRVKVMGLERIIKSKEAAGRDKDKAVLPMLRDVLACTKIQRP